MKIKPTIKLNNIKFNIKLILNLKMLFLNGIFVLDQFYLKIEQKNI